MDFIFMWRGGGYIIKYSLNWSGWHIFQKPFHDLPFQPSWQYRTTIFCQVFVGQLLPLVHWTLQEVFLRSWWSPQHVQIWCGTCLWLAPQTISWVGSSHLWDSVFWSCRHLWGCTQSKNLWLLQRFHGIDKDVQIFFNGTFKKGNNITEIHT